MHINHLSCTLCGYSLSPPVTISRACSHNFHEKCFFGVLETGSCPQCKIAVTHGDRNPRLEHVITTVNRLSQSIMRDSRVAPKDKLFHDATREGEVEVMNMLLEEGVVVSTLVGGCSALYVACKYTQVEAVRLLLEKGADFTQKNDLSNHLDWRMDNRNENNMTPMGKVIIEGSIELASLFMEYRAPFHGVDEDGNSFLLKALYARQENMALFLIDKGIELGKRGQNDDTELIVATRLGFFNVVKALVAKEVPVNEATRSRVTALHVAAESDNHELLYFLLQNGAKDVINSICRGIWTPLALAIAEDHVENVKILVREGADLSIKHNEMSVFEFAEQRYHSRKNFYQSRPQCSKIEEKTLEKRQAIIDFLSLGSSEPLEHKESENREPKKQESADAKPNTSVKKTCVIS